MMRILIPLDGSKASEEVLGHLSGVAPSDATYYLLHAVPVPVLSSGLAAEASRTLENRAKHYLEQVHAAHGNRRIHRIVQTGDAPEAILKAALRYNVDLIAMTTHARTGLTRWMLGSVAERVLRTTGLPVFLVRPGLPVPSQARRRILVPVDSGDVSAEIVDTVRGYALQADAEVVLMHVVPKAKDQAGLPQTVVPSSLTSRTRRRLEKKADDLEEKGLYAWSFITHGEPGMEILKEAAKVDAALIAMTTRCREGLERLVVGSIGQEVLREAPCPVLLQKNLRRVP